MSRPLRIEFAGGLYHVTSRGDGREAIFLAEEDGPLFLGVLSEVVQNFNWAMHACCLMDNHYHLLAETPDGNLSKGMRQLNESLHTTLQSSARPGRACFSGPLQSDHRAEGPVSLGTGPPCRPQPGQGGHIRKPGPNGRGVVTGPPLAWARRRSG
jgi:REP element-mobilizing transposase RayT